MLDNQFHKNDVLCCRTERADSAVQSSAVTLQLCTHAQA